MSTYAGLRPLPTALLGMGLLAMAAGCLPSAFAFGFGFFDGGPWLDVTPADALDRSRVPDGTGIWLRGLRDRSVAITLADGRVLYPTEHEPSVMVDCAGTGCVGTLQGRIEDLTVQGALPSPWPDGVGRSVRVLVVGTMGDSARQKVTLSASIGIALLALGLISCVAGILMGPRRREP